MRVRLSLHSNAECFSETLLETGNGSFPENPNRNNTITLPFGSMVQNPYDLVSSIYPSINLNCRDHKWLSERAILTPKNAVVNNISIMDMIDGDPITYLCP